MRTGPLIAGLVLLLPAIFYCYIVWDIPFSEDATAIVLSGYSAVSATMFSVASKGLVPAKIWGITAIVLAVYLLFTIATL